MVRADGEGSSPLQHLTGHTDLRGEVTERGERRPGGGRGERARWEVRGRELPLEVMDLRASVVECERGAGAGAGPRLLWGRARRLEVVLEGRARWPERLRCEPVYRLVSVRRE